MNQLPLLTQFNFKLMGILYLKNAMPIVIIRADALACLILEKPHATN